MTIVDLDLLATFRAATQCGWCRKPTPSGCDPAHLWARGLGGAHRIDASFNLIALCRLCHTEAHAGNIAREDLLLMVAHRDGVNQCDIVAAVHFLQRIPKHWNRERIEAGMEELDGGARVLVRRVLK